jgi:hypothetical protein
MNSRPLLFFSLFAGLSVPSFADIVEVNFSGFIQSSGFNSVTVNDPFSGTAFYSTTAVALETDPSPCPTPSSTSFCTAHYPFPFTVSISVDGSTISSIPAEGLLFGDNLQVTSTPSGGGVAWLSGGYQLAIAGPLQAEQLSGIDSLLVEFDDGDNPADADLIPPSTQLGDTFPGLNQFNTVDFETNAASGGAFTEFQGIITSVDSEVVPEPGMFPIFCLLLMGTVLLKARRSLHSIYKS